MGKSRKFSRHVELIYIYTNRVSNLQGFMASCKIPFKCQCSYRYFFVFFFSVSDKERETKKRWVLRYCSSVGNRTGSPHIMLVLNGHD